MNEYRVSVIVPVYNVEQWVEKCIRSLMEQTLEALEVIVVNDASTDGSMDVVQRVLAEFPLRAPHVRIINHDHNMGVAAARMHGMQAMQGEYMAHCDADDWADPDMYERLYSSAKADDADMATCRYLNEPDGRGPLGTTFNGPAMECLRRGLYTYGLWDKLIRAKLIKENDIYPFEGINYNEDLAIIVRALCFCNRVVGLEQPLYHHLMDREGSICTDNYRRHVLQQSVPCMRMLDEWLDDTGRRTGRKEINSRLTRPLKFWMKSGFYVNGEYAQWRRLWPECRSHIMRIDSMSMKEKLLMLLRSVL